MWEIDSQINDNHLDDAERDSAKLHSKYLNLLAPAKIKLKQAELAQKTLLKEKWLYYNGKMDKETIEEHGWPFDPLEGLKLLKGDMDRYYDADKDIQKSEEMIEYWKVVISTLDEIITTIRWRSQKIKNMIEWRKFESGG